MIVKYKKNSKRITIVSIITLLAMGFVFYTITGFAQEKKVFNEQFEVTDNAKNAMVKAQEFITKNDFSGARKPLLDYIAAKPDHIPAELYLMLGYCWYADQSIKKEKALDNALPVFEEGYDAYPENFDLMSYYAAVLYWWCKINCVK